MVCTSALAVYAWNQRAAAVQARDAIRAQSQLLTETAAERLKDNDVTGAQGIILAVLADPKYAAKSDPQAINVFQEIRAADLQLAVLSGHAGFVVSAAYSPDGSRIVTASDGAIAKRQTASNR